jgi:hypothetical protein
MSRVLYGIEKGLRLYAENSQTDFVDLLFGSSAPLGTSGDTAEASIGSIYLRTDGSLYQKIADTDSALDWQLNGATSASIGTWRPESLVLVTNETQGAGTRDMVASPFSDDNGTPVPIGEYVVGKYIISDADGSPLLLEITAVSGDDVTYAVASPALSADDTFVVRNYLPDADGLENNAIVNYNGSIMLKIADIDWNFANGIQMAAGYTAQNGNISNADSVNSAIEKLDGNQQDLITLSGVAQGEVDLGAFSGDIIADDQTVKAALQDLETELVDTRDNVDDLITLSGVAENSTDFGTFTGNSLADAQTAKQLFQRIEVLLEQMRGVQVAGITTITTVDSVPHADVKACKWLVEVFEVATPANRQAIEVYALTNGTLIDDTQYAKLKVGSNFNLSLSVDVSGADMRLRAASTSAGVTVTARRIEVVQSVL